MSRRNGRAEDRCARSGLRLRNVPLCKPLETLPLRLQGFVHFRNQAALPRCLQLFS